MKALVVGLGSMGKRRIRLVREIDNTIEIVGVDTRDDRKDEVQNQFGIQTVNTIKEAVELGCTIAFICTSPLSHASIINECLHNDLHIFTEINLVSDRYRENINLAKEKGKVLFLSSTFNYREEIQYIQNQVEESKSLLSYSYHIGQYLPDWHPWENYKNYFIGDVRTNGCREIMAIELPWLYKTFGPVVDIQVKRNKKTTLQTTYPDSYLMLLEHQNGVQGALLVDVVSRKAVRNLEIYGEDLYLSWNGSPSSLAKYDYEKKVDCKIDLYEKIDQEKGYAAFVVENAYRNEIVAFLDQIVSGKPVKYTFAEDLSVLNLIDSIEGELKC